MAILAPVSMCRPATNSSVGLRSFGVLIAALAVTLAVVASGCGEGRSPNDVKSENFGSGSKSKTAPGFPVSATKNTTRVGGGDAAENAAAVALAVYPSQTDRQRPGTVILVDEKNWPAALAAAVLSHAPLKAPILLTDGGGVPGATGKALAALRPKGSPKVQGAQVVRIGAAPAPGFVHGVVVAGGDPFEQAAAIDAFQATAAGKSSDDVVIAAIDQPALALPAAGWAAKSGDPLLYVSRNQVPQPTEAAIARHGRPAIFVMGPRNVVSGAVLKKLKSLGSSVAFVGSADPATNAVEFARFRRGGFGWGVVDPGHGLAIVNRAQMVDAAYASLLSNSGTYGPLLLVDRPDALPKVDRDFLLDIQPGFVKDPSRGVYNHAWLIGSVELIGAGVQAQIDSLLEIQPVDQPSTSSSKSPPQTTPSTQNQPNATNTTTTPAGGTTTAGQQPANPAQP